MKQLWAVYDRTQHNPFGGRRFVGYAGWHENATDALAEAKRRNPNENPDHLQVNRA